MAVDDDLDLGEPDEPEPDPGPAPEKPKRVRKSRAGRKPTTRFERRASKAEETVRGLVELGRPDLDVSELTFSEVVHRDAPAWGRFLAQIGEWVPAFGGFIDLFFGQALQNLLGMAPTVRAARRDLVLRREARRAAEREQEDEEGGVEPAAENGDGGGGAFDLDDAELPA